jgi:hypothetical protein
VPVAHCEALGGIHGQGEGVRAEVARALGGLTHPGLTALRCRAWMGGFGAGQRVVRDGDSRWVGPGLRRSCQPNTRIGANRHQPLRLPSSPKISTRGCLARARRQVPVAHCEALGGIRGQGGGVAWPPALIGGLGDPVVAMVSCRVPVGGSDAGHRVVRGGDSRWVYPWIRRPRRPNTRIGANRHPHL